MIQTNLKPQERFVKFIEASDEHPKLKVEIKIYNSPVALTDAVSIFTTVEILEEDDHLFGILLYESIFTEKEVEEQFNQIIADPMKYKTSLR